MIISNLYDKKSKLTEIFYTTDLLDIISNLGDRAFKDNDIETEIKSLIKTVGEAWNQATSFDRYKKEVENRVLQWSNVHKEDFFLDNLKKFEEMNFNIIKLLIGILDINQKANPDLDIYNKNVEIALNDLGIFLSKHQNGKPIVEKFGGKDYILGYMKHKNNKISKQALITTQKLMIKAKRNI